MLREFLKEYIMSEAEQRGMRLTYRELDSAITGVEYWIMEGIGDSVDTALFNIQYDRKN